MYPRENNFSAHCCISKENICIAEILLLKSHIEQVYESRINKTFRFNICLGHPDVQ